MSIYTRFFNKASILSLVVLLGLVLGCLRQLHNGWVWYYFLSHPSNDSAHKVIVVNKHLLPENLEDTLRQLPTLHSPYQELLGSVHQYGVASNNNNGLTRIIVKTSLAHSQQLEHELQQQGLQTMRFAGFILGQSKPFDKVAILKNISLNVGKNYLSKRPIVVGHLPAGELSQKNSTVIIAEPYQAGIKAYIALNKDKITAHEKDTMRRLQPLPAVNYNMAMLSKEQVNSISSGLQQQINTYLLRQLGFRHTAPDLLTTFSLNNHFAVVSSQSDLAISANLSGTNSEFGNMILKYLNHEEAYGHPITQTFPLPNGRSGQEVVPDLTQTYFTSTPGSCQSLKGKAINIVLCQTDTTITISTNPDLASIAQDSLRQSDADWQFSIQGDSLSTTPRLQTWNRLSGYRNDQDIAFFLEK